jgi:DMSO/TMAO reductase YedYZ molybdopterin-dependent catalytic subunit
VSKTPLRKDPDLLSRAAEPLNFEFPFATVEEFVTPVTRFFVRNHFPQPDLDAAGWRLAVEGEVERPVELTYSELLALPACEVTSLLECAGNSRSLLEPAVKGVPWHMGAVGNAVWTGASLSSVLERAGLRPGAVEVVLQGADAGAITQEPKTPGVIHYARSIPCDEALRPEVLLAYRMNGEPLRPEHGAPVRALVPGWYGMASVKWLTRVVVTDRPFQGYFQTFDYTRWDRSAGLPTLVPLGEIPVKAAIARPTAGERIPAGTARRIEGAAWAGPAAVARVEVSTDGGTTWSAARLLGEAVPYTWRLWQHDWQVPATPGPRTLLARATDDRGRTQPPHRDPDRNNYMINHVLPVEVEVG